MAIKIYDGDLITSPANVLIHQANCYCTMGTGIALKIKETYPEAYSVDLSTPKQIEGKLGGFSWEYIDRDNIDKIVINLYGQGRFGRDRRYTNYEALAVGFEQIKFFLQDLKDRFQKYDDTMPRKIAIQKSKIPENIIVGLPYKMGCVNAGGDWNVVMAIINSVFESQDFEILICKLENQE